MKTSAADSMSADFESGTVENLVKSSLEEASEFITPEPVTPPSYMGEFAKTPIAAKLSGTYNETTGLLKRKFGEFTSDVNLQEEGLSQEILGKVHLLVGSIRTIRIEAQEKLELKKIEAKNLIRKHSLKLLDVATEITDDVKKLLLK